MLIFIPWVIGFSEQNRDTTEPRGMSPAPWPLTWHSRSAINQLWDPPDYLEKMFSYSEHKEVANFGIPYFSVLKKSLYCLSQISELKEGRFSVDFLWVFSLDVELLPQNGPSPLKYFSHNSWICSQPRKYLQYVNLQHLPVTLIILLHPQWCVYTCHCFSLSDFLLLLSVFST